MTKDYLDISELSVKLELINKKTGKPANYILRFWEKEFSGIKPTLLKGNRRYYDKKQVEEKFSGMLNALSYGAPPHGGIAPGIDRIVMLLADEKNIREVTLFPMNQNAEDLMMNAPSKVEAKQLKELGVKIDIKKN